MLKKKLSKKMIFLVLVIIFSMSYIGYIGYFKLKSYEIDSDHDRRLRSLFQAIWCYSGNNDYYLPSSLTQLRDYGFRVGGGVYLPFVEIDGIPASDGFTVYYFGDTLGKEPSRDSDDQVLLLAKAKDYNKYFVVYAPSGKIVHYSKLEDVKQLLNDFQNRKKVNK